MRETKTITLNHAFEHHGQTVRTITLQEPTGGQFQALGEPRVFVRTGQGGYWVEQPNIIKAYLDKNIDHQDGSVLLSLMSLADSMQMKDALLGFFIDAESMNIERQLAFSSSEAGL